MASPLTLVLFACHALLATAAPFASSSQAKARLVYQFPTNLFIENIVVRPNGNLILSTFDGGRLYNLDPSCKDAQPRVIAQLPNANATTGITEIAPDKFAVVGGLLIEAAFNYILGSVGIYTLDASNPTATGEATVELVAHVPNTTMYNALAALPAFPHIVLASESGTGSIYRINTDTGAVDLAFSSPLLLPSTDPTRVPLGVNGIKIHSSYLYFANSALGTFGRIPISPRGDATGEGEIIHKLDPSEVAEAYDDFAIDEHGVAYVSLHPSSFVKITLDGKQTTLLGEDNSTSFPLLDPTSAALRSDQRAVYAVTSGTITGSGPGGQVVELQI